MKILRSYRHGRERILYHHYQRPPDDSQSALSAWMDSFGFLLLLGVMSYLFFSSVTGRSAALAGSVAVVLPGIWLTGRLKRKKHHQYDTHCRNWLAAQHCREKLAAMKHDEFKGLVEELLSKEGITFKAPLKGGKGNTGWIGDYIARRGKEEILVRVVNLPFKSKATGTGVVEEFVGTLAANEMRSGILVTSGTFTDDAHEIKEIVRGHYDLRLVEQPDLIYMAQQYGHSFYPSRQLLDGLVREYRTGKKIKYKSSLKKEFLMPVNKIGAYALSGGLLIFFSTWQHDLLASFYLLFGIFNLILAAAGLAWRIWELARISEPEAKES